jgi:SRSO17 transposase
VGVSRQYFGALGKVANCQSVVSWHFANEKFHLPLIAELYLPQSWIDNKEKLRTNGVPDRRLKFQKKWEIALDLFSQIKDYAEYEAILCDAGYREIPEFLNELDKKNVKFLAQIPERMSFWPEELQVQLPENISKKVGRPNKHPKSLTPDIKPVKAKNLIPNLLKQHSFEKVKIHLKYKKEIEIFAVRLRQSISQSWICPGPERWLIVEKFQDGYKYYISNLPENTSLDKMAKLIHSRWKIEQGY